MYISKLEIENYRCFGSRRTLRLRQGVNIFIGENNSGKTTVLNALGFLFDRRGRSLPGIDDFNKSLRIGKTAPRITIGATLSSTPEDTIEDKALVATWLTSIGKNWEARLTYSYHLPGEDEQEFEAEIGKNLESKEHFWSTLEKFQPRYVSRIYCGNEEDRRRAEPDSLEKFEMRLLKPIRDVESEMFSGSQPLLRRMLQQVLDRKKTEDEKNILNESFKTEATKLLDGVKSRLDTDFLFSLVSNVGASEGGSPVVEGRLTEVDLLRALNLAIPQYNNSIPLTQNGLGYNNLIYMALLLRSMEHMASEKHGQNAIAYSMLAVEEPEAHLHPALQYKLLKYFMTTPARQIFITTHSTHITAAAGLQPIVHLSVDASGEVIAVNPSDCFKSDKPGLISRKYVERYLDATKSNMLFCKAVLFVEGISEQLLIPALAEYLPTCSLDKRHVAIINVGGSTFRHFLPLFGAGTPSEVPHLRCRVACIPDGDPTRRRKNQPKARYQKCYPYELDADNTSYEYQHPSSTVSVLALQTDGTSNIQVKHSTKTLEYDLAYANENSTLILTDSCTNRTEMEHLVLNKALDTEAAATLLNQSTIEALESVDSSIQPKAVFASAYMESLQNSKGQHALELAEALRENAKKPPPDRQLFIIPEYIKQAIQWVCSEELH